jgi:tryptophan synthase alpha chain
MASASATTSPSRPQSRGTQPASIAETFDALRARHRRAFVPYLTAGHPDADRSVELLRAIAPYADVIELGVPFSDPMADGPVIQASSQRALEQGISFDGTLDIAKRAAVSVPLVLFTYLNPLMAAGPGAMERAREAGFSGVLVTDLPVGADRAREEQLGKSPLAFIRLVAPTTPRERMREIAAHGSGFVYVISRLGVTGARNDVPADLAETVGRLRGVTTLPLCVGFGVSRPEHAAAVARLADGVVVGSAMVRAAGESVAAAAALAREMRDAIDSVA